MQNIALAFSLLLMISSCSKSSVEPVETDLSEQVLIDVSYSNDARQKMDIHMPAGRSRLETRVFVLVHGGGWTAGDKNDFNLQVAELKKRFPTYVIANINYRLYSDNQHKFPTQEHDVNAAVQFLLSKSAAYSYSKEFILVGSSAGAHLALLQAYKHAGTVRPRAVISYFGPTDLADLYSNAPNPDISNLLNALTGTTPAQNLQVYQQSSPVHFVKAGSTPSLLLHGEKDDLIPKSQSILLRNKLQSVNVSNKLVLYPNEAHNFTGNNLMHSFDEIEAFLKLHVK